MQSIRHTCIARVAVVVTALMHASVRPIADRGEHPRLAGRSARRATADRVPAIVFVS